jgi:hypothetical protein
MRTTRWLAGLLLIFCTWTGTAGAAPVHDWFFTMDVPLTMDLRFPGDRGKQTTASSSDVRGVLLGLVTAYHVGFGLDFITGHFRPQPNLDLQLEATILNVIVDVPMQSWTLNLGAGWGEARFKPNVFREDAGTGELVPMNLYQGLIRVGRRLGSRFDVHVGYQEFHGQGLILHRNRTPMDTETFDLTGAVYTVGGRLDF